mgnify:FL=1
MELIKDFKNINKNDAALAGGKGASLGEMTQAGIPVPPGFVILSTTFDQFIKDADLVQEIEAILEKVDHKEIHTVENASEKIQGLIKNAVMPESIAIEIKKQFKKLDTEFVAVRSSATAEDGAENAWAGQLDSFLNTKEEDLLIKVQSCWASLFTSRAIFYRFEKGLHTTQISVAVVVQKMVNSEISGIVFSVHPVTEDRNQIIIEAGFGLGEAIVSGSITPDSYVVEKEPRKIIDINIATQTRGLYRVQNGGNEWLEIKEPRASSQVLSEGQILEFSNIILGIETHYGFPCDIEWAYENKRFYIVQSRPITTLKNVANEHRPNFQKLLSRKHALLTDEIIATAWNDRGRFKDLTGFPDYVENLEIVDGDFCFDLNWTNKIINQYKDINLKTIWKFINDGYRYGEIIKNYSRNLKPESSKKELTKQFYKSVDLLKNLLVFLPITHPLVNIIEGKVITILKEKNVQDNELNDILFDVSAPIKKNTPVLENEDLLEIKKRYQENKNFGVDNALVKHADSYGFLGYREPFSTGYDKNFFKMKLKDQKQETKQRKINNVEFTDDEQKYVDLLKEFVYFRTYRTEKLYESLYYLEPLWRKISNEFGLNNDTDIGWYNLGEINNLFKSETKVAYTELDSRKIGHAILLHDGRFETIFANQMSEFKKKHYPEQKPSENQISGVAACKGKVSGIAKIVKSSKEQDKIRAGDILVTAMTTPDYLPCMNKAVAFVTDEGGITCHAAIVAREMNKPCIIGTKIATQVLKDGDLIEVDANNGIVKILKCSA